MNKMNFVATAVALSALCLAGCSNDAEEPGTEPQPGRQVMMTMQASTAEPQTRADYTEDGDNNMMLFSWREGDAISVCVDGYKRSSHAPNKNCMLTTKEEGKSVPFSGRADAWTETRNIYAVYPYKQSDAYGNGYVINTSENPSTTNVGLTLANPQEFTVGGAFTNGFLVGAGTATVEGEQIKVSPVSMKQVMSFVRFNITEAPGNVTKVTMAGQSNIFPTTAFAYMSTGERKQDSATSGYKTELTMNVTDNTGPGNKSVSFALWPFDYTGAKITITITFEGGKVITLPTKQGMKFERNVHYVVDVNGTDAAKPVSVWDGSIGTQPAGYDTAIPRKVDITSAAELAWLAKECNIGGKTFEGYTFNLTTDIDLDNHEWTPIGNFDNRFAGKFNGQGHTVRNMEVDIKGEIEVFAGFFGFVEGTKANPAKVSNLIVEGNVNGEATTFAVNAGGICGRAFRVDIEFCRFNGTISGNFTTEQQSSCCGGIVGDYTGDNNHSLTCCISDATVTAEGIGTLNRGGLVGSLAICPVTYSAWNSNRIAKGVDHDMNSTFADTNKPFTTIAGLNDLLDDMNDSKSESEYKWKAGDNTNASPILVKRTPSGTN